MDTIAKLKSDLLAELNVQYKNLIAFIRNTPVNEQFKNYAFQNLDQGVMWLHKGIDLIQIQTQVPESQIPPNVESIKNNSLDGDCCTDPSMVLNDSSKLN